MNRIKLETLNTLATLENNEVIVPLDTDINMSVKKYLSMREFNKFVSEMTDAQFLEGEFRPQYDSIVFDIALCEYYTNLELPENIESAYELIHRLDLKRKILNVIEHTEQYQSLVSCIAKAHDFVRTQKTGFNGLMTALKDAIEDFNIEEILATLKDFDLQKLEHLTELRDLAKIFTTPQSKDTKTVPFPTNANE